MRLLWIALFTLVPAAADSCRVWIEGTGCRTRQLAIQRAFAAIEGVEKVEVLPRGPDGEANHRVFVVHAKGAPPTRERLEQALGRKSWHYRIQRLENVPEKPLNGGSGSS